MQVKFTRQDLRQAMQDAASRQDAAAILSSGRSLIAASGALVDVKFCASIFANNSAVIKDQLKARTLKTFVVRSVTIEPILPFLAVEAVFSNYLLDIRVGGFGSYFDELMSPTSELARFAPDVALILLDLEDIAGRLPDLCADGIGAGVEAEIEEALARFEQLLRNFRSRSSCRLVVQGCVLPDLTSLGDVGDANVPYSLPNAVMALNSRLAALCRAISDCVFFDVDRLAARSGRREWRDRRLFLSSRLPVSANAFPVFARALVRSIASLFRAPRKVLCTDLDNTLWGGVLGEDGPDGIATGNAFPGNCYLEYQRYLKQLSARGILLAAVSKNNVADVEEAFQLRAADLALTLDDFVATKIGWTDKSASLRALADELSLGLDSFVFVDDNPVECAAIRQDLPEVFVIEASVPEPWRLVEILSDAALFDAVIVTEDDLMRLKEYKAQAERAEVANAAGSRDEFLASLDIVCTFLSALEAPLARSVQLLAKTNQFNLTTRRHSSADVENFTSSPGGQAIAVRVRDRFGDAGVVGLALARNVGNACHIDSLLLSCRVIGRGIETALLAHVAQHARDLGAERLVGEFVPSKKNAPCADFYADHGFTQLPSSEGTDSIFFEFNLAAETLTSPTWITLEGTTPHELTASASLSS